MLTNCHTYYSFRYGTYSTEDLIDEVIQQGYNSFALTDINNTSACIDTIRISQDKNIKAIIGIDFRNGIQQQYVGLAINNTGFKELNTHLSLHLHSKVDFDNVAPDFNNAYIIYPLKNYKGQDLKENEFVGVSIKEVNSYNFSKINISQNKMVVLQSVSFANKRNFNAHRLLRAIDKNTLLSKLTLDEQATTEEIILSKTELYEAFKEYPTIIHNTESILNDCNVTLQYGKFANKNKTHFTDSVHNDLALLRSESERGLKYRYNEITPIITARIEKELEIIAQMGFASYYLINWDLVKFAKSKNYYHVGRGSGANSLVAYLLGITDVDPIQLDLYFERFINPFRSTPPDFDIDFSWTDRDDITDYIFKTYGNEHTALLGSYNTFQKNAVVREIGKVFGLPPGEIDKLQNAHKYNDIDETGKQVLRYSQFIDGFPNHLSIHSSGIIISQEPINCYCGTFMPPKGFPTTQFSMLEAEDIGLYKFDILSQRGLGKIKDSIQLIKDNTGDDIDVHDVEKFKNDEKVKDLLRVGNTIGCFYVESPAMRMLLAKLQADDYLRLVAASSIIRPGVSKSGMMREYILRFRNKHLRDKAEKELPELYALLEETYGVMVYQEDVIKIAHLFADLSLAEADYLRRGMSWKFKQRNEFNIVKENFFNNCYKKGYSEQVIFNIWNQIESFANFAFSKGHSASYAVESYQALYLKAYYPLEYMVATLNNGGGFYRTELYVHEARMQGAEIKPPCVNSSGAMCAIKGKTIYLGLRMISELEEQTTELILMDRVHNGLFKDLRDFIKRVPLSIEQMRLLIRAGTFDFIGKNKKELLWEIHTLINPIRKKITTHELFEVENKTWNIPNLPSSELDNAFDEMELFGFSLSSPFNLLRNKNIETITAKDLKNHLNKIVTILAYQVNVKTTFTSNTERMAFGTFLDIEGYWVDTVHFPPSLKQAPFTGPGCYLITGKVTEEYDFVSIEVSGLKRMAVVDREI